METLEEILEKFQNGQRRYDEDINFQQAVESLVNGVGVYAVLDNTLKHNKMLRDMVVTEASRVLTTKELYPNELETLRGVNVKQAQQITELNNYIHQLHQGI